MAKVPKVNQKAPELKDNGGFSRHDLSHYFGFKFAPGHAVPVYADLLNPNERVKLKVNSFIRLQPMITPAFLDLECTIDYFFVPLEMLSMTFGRSFSNTREFFSSFVASNEAISTTLTKWNGRQTSSGPEHDMLRIQQLSDISNYGLFTDHPKRVISAAGRPAFEDLGCRMIRLMDYLGLDLPLAYNYKTSQPQSSTDVIVSDQGVQITDIYPQTSDGALDPNLGMILGNYQASFPWKILAYNAIWENWYRLDDFIKYDNSYFNIDRLAVSSYAAEGMVNPLSVQSGYIHWPCIKYVPKKADYFVSSVNNPVVQNLNIVGSQLPFNYQYLTDFTAAYLETTQNTAADASLTNPLVSSVYNPYDENLSMARFRLVKAQEKMLQIYGRLPKKNYDNFVYALFGQKVPHDVKHELSHLGSDSFKINVGQVTSMASTDDAPLGEFAGTAAGSSKSRGIKFTAPCHGIIMAIQYVRPEYMYCGGFLRENYIAGTNDFFLPPYDNLGRQPIYYFERGKLANAYSTNATDILAWQYRWQQFKSKYNRVSRAFQFGSERSWFLVQDNEYSIEHGSGSANYDVGFRYVDPCCLNDIMVQQFDPFFEFQVLTQAEYNAGKRWNQKVNYFLNPALVFSTDPFICIDKIECSKFSKMSVYSLQTID